MSNFIELFEIYGFKVQKINVVCRGCALTPRKTKRKADNQNRA